MIDQWHHASSNTEGSASVAAREICNRHPLQAIRLHGPGARPDVRRVDVDWRHSDGVWSQSNQSIRIDRIESKEERRTTNGRTRRRLSPAAATTGEVMDASSHPPNRGASVALTTNLETVPL